MDLALSPDTAVSAAEVVFLAGLVLPPVVLLWLGHGFRHRSAELKWVFWGGITGYAGITMVWLAALMLPPVSWTAGHGGRPLVVYWGLLVGALAGALVGFAAAKTRSRG